MTTTEAFNWTKKTAAITAFASAAIWCANFGIEKFNHHVAPFLANTFVNFLGLGSLGKSLLSAQNLMIVALASQSAHFFMDSFKQDKGDGTQNFINSALHGILGYSVAVAGTCLTTNLLDSKTFTAAHDFVQGIETHPSR